ncbi:hypothetical protein [Paraburkholderia tuberum]|nr:hypothetical protein [Paraburkholderia tuberum]
MKKYFRNNFGTRLDQFSICDAAGDRAPLLEELTAMAKTTKTGSDV